MLVLYSEPVRVVRQHYPDGRVRLQVIALDGEPFATATVDLPDVPMADDEVAIKDDTENVGLLDWLVSNHIVTEPVRMVSGPFAEVPICRLLPQE